MLVGGYHVHCVGYQAGAGAPSAPYCTPSTVQSTSLPPTLYCLPVTPHPHSLSPPSPIGLCVHVPPLGLWPPDKMDMLLEGMHGLKDEISKLHIGKRTDVPGANGPAYGLLD